MFLCSRNSCMTPGCLFERKHTHSLVQYTPCVSHTIALLKTQWTGKRGRGAGILSNSSGGWIWETMVWGAEAGRGRSGQDGKMVTHSLLLLLLLWHTMPWFLTINRFAQWLNPGEYPSNQPHVKTSESTYTRSYIWVGWKIGHTHCPASHTMPWFVPI